MSAHRGLVASVGFAALLALSGCSSVSGGGGPFAGIFGGGAEPVAAEAPVATSFEDFVGSDPTPCPRPEVIQGSAAQRVYRSGRSGSNQDLRYQIAVIDLARECVSTPEGQNRIKLGVQGRVLIGPAGGPGSFTAPVRIRVRTPSTVYEDVARRVAVTVPAGQTLADFTLVEEGLEIPLSVGDNFLIEVGIDG
ncbi:hypothetical protein [Salinarimonas rosea]|uniref:hypothetical protein n=1 Tax=Salinarimonas rosea TaxID=552063 RepID=UPI0004096FE8|nr:hypothetical protein [Salinarimonas rosea]